MTPFHTQLSIHIGQNDIIGANNLIMSEMGKVYVYHRPDFIALLQNSDLPAHADFADEQLINMYFENIHKKDLLVGTALLVNEHNKVSGFDGDLEMSDKSVKDCYRAMSNFFGGVEGIPSSAGYKQEHQFDWKYSGIVGLGALAAKGIGAAVKNKENAKAEMQKKIMLEKQKQKELKNKKIKIAVLVGAGILVAVTIGIIIYKRKKK